MGGTLIKSLDITRSVALVTDPAGVVTVIGADIAENVLEFWVSPSKDGMTNVRDVGVAATTVAAV
jgi:hypothetical protein